MDYKLIQVVRDNLTVHAKFLSEVFKGTTKYSEDFLDWQYYQNPQGNVVGYDAYLGDQLAAHYVTIPVLFLYEGKEVKGLLSLNTATHEKHQGKGLFTKLA